jgi:hypothetical protein
VTPEDASSFELPARYQRDFELVKAAPDEHVIEWLKRTDEASLT